MRISYAFWKSSLIILLILFFLGGISSVSYTATLYLLLGFLIAWLIKTALPFIRNYVIRIPKYTLIISILFLLYIFSSLLVFRFSTTSNVELLLPIKKYEISVKLASLQIQNFIIEKRVLIDEEEFTKLIIHSFIRKENPIDIEKKIANIRFVVISREEIDGIGQGLILREVSILPMRLIASAEKQLNDQLNLSEDVSFTGISCATNKCSKLIIELVDFPQGTFYQAKEPINFKRSSYLNTETIRWSSLDLEKEIRFAYIPPPYNNFEKLIKLFSWFNSAENYLVVLLGAGLAFILMPRVEKLLRKIKPTVNVQTLAIARSQSMSGDRHINTSGGNYIESNRGTYIQGNYITMSQDLTHAAAQIQDLIKQLQKQGVTLDVAQEQVARDMATQAQTNSTIKDKLLKWGQSLGDATVNDVVKGAVKLAIRSAGIPLP